MDILKVAIWVEGGVGKLADALSVKQNVVSNWQLADRSVPNPWVQVLKLKYSKKIAAYKAAHPESREVA